MTGCRHFSGYKPCGLSENCDSACPHFSIARPYVLIVHLEALGAVLRATTVLPAIKARYPKSHITWVTQAPAQHLLKPNSLIDRVLTTSNEDLLALRALEFDLALVVDKSLKAAGVAQLARSKELRGFFADPKTGAILPANFEANELWELGLSNHKKFFVNKKPETQLITEAMGFSWQRDEYAVELTAQERQLAFKRRAEWSKSGELIIGLNTGCSGVIPYKRWTVDFHRELIAKLAQDQSVKIVLLGGPEDTERNREIAAGLPVMESPTDGGLRDGLTSVEACDIVVSGDSLGMHMGIALRKWVVAWFGPTCAHEIDLYDRGVHILADVPCGPCWKRSCSNPVMCYDQVPMAKVLEAIQKGREWKISSFKPRISATSSSASL